MPVQREPGDMCTIRLCGPDVVPAYAAIAATRRAPLRVTRNRAGAMPKGRQPIPACERVSSKTAGPADTVIVDPHHTPLPQPGTCYFFFAGLLGTAVFDAAGQAPSTAGDSSFLGCLGFFASRLPSS